MTDGAFSLSPPGSFALSADPAFQDEVRHELERLLDRVRELRRRSVRRRRSADGKFRAWRGNRNLSFSNQKPVVERCRVPGGGPGRHRLNAGDSISRCGRSSATPTRIAATRRAGSRSNCARYLSEGMLRLRPTIFTPGVVREREAALGRSCREFRCRRAPLGAQTISKHDAFRLLNNRIIEQIAVRSEYSDRTSDTHCGCILADQILDRPGNVAVGFSGMLSACISEQAKTGRGRAARAS